MIKQQQSYDQPKQVRNASPTLAGSMGLDVSKEELDEIATKIPGATDALRQAIEIICALLEQTKDGCTIRALCENDTIRRAGLSAHHVSDAVAGLMLAEKATYTGDKPSTVIKANKKLERFIIHRIYNTDQVCAVDQLQEEAEREGISPDDFRDALMAQSIRDRITIENGQIKRRLADPPAKTKDWERASPGSPAERYYEEAAPTTFQPRNEFAKDHERILYSSAFRRLAGVTQVFGTSEGHVFHNRLTHSIKAGQIARSIAERLNVVEPDVVEAAALAHDLGHPPFGHTGESELDRLLKEQGVPDGYEGNAQNLRIVTQLSRVRREFRGLNLTRATLNALMKYPWLREPEGVKSKKWNAYSSEKRFFDFARSERRGEEKSQEAQVMEWADDIAYGVHDIEDGVRAGMIPLSELLNDAGERERFLEGSREWWGKQPCFNNSKEEAEYAFNILVVLAQRELRRPYDDDAAQQAALRQLTTVLHHRYILAVTSERPEPDEQRRQEQVKLQFRPEYEREVTILKCLMRFYVFCNPVLLPQQYGQRRVISDLFGYFLEAAQSNDARSVFPSRVRELLDEDDSVDPQARTARARARAAADTVAGMTEWEALAMHRVVTGTDPGRIRGRIVS